MCKFNNEQCPETVMQFLPVLYSFRKEEGGKDKGGASLIKFLCKTRKQNTFK